MKIQLPTPVFETISQQTARHSRSGVIRDSPSCDNMVTFLRISDHCFILISFLLNFCIYFLEFIVKYYHIFFKITISSGNFINFFCQTNIFLLFLCRVCDYIINIYFFIAKISCLSIFNHINHYCLHIKNLSEKLCYITGILRNLFASTKKARKQFLTVFMLSLSYISLILRVILFCIQI